MVKNNNISIKIKNNENRQYEYSSYIKHRNDLIFLNSYKSVDIFANATEIKISNDSAQLINNEENNEEDNKNFHFFIDIVWFFLYKFKKKLINKLIS
ncbi:Hypothetical protein KVN_LOCUS537 [uncultured virus]|nr:Hypothetical protein KVN_LOCUS537 [uncultured virus]